MCQPLDTYTRGRSCRPRNYSHSQPDTPYHFSRPFSPFPLCESESWVRKESVEGANENAEMAGRVRIEKSCAETFLRFLDSNGCILISEFAWNASVHKCTRDRRGFKNTDWSLAEARYRLFAITIAVVTPCEYPEIKIPRMLFGQIVYP